MGTFVFTQMYLLKEAQDSSCVALDQEGVYNILQRICLLRFWDTPKQVIGGK